MIFQYFSTTVFWHLYFCWSSFSLCLLGHRHASHLITPDEAVIVANSKCCIQTTNFTYVVRKGSRNKRVALWNSQNILFTTCSWVLRLFFVSCVWATHGHGIMCKIQYNVPRDSDETKTRTAPCRGEKKNEYRLPRRYGGNHLPYRINYFQISLQRIFL